MNIAGEKHWQAAFSDYPLRLRELIAGYDRPAILELGGGRRPSLDLADLLETVGSYTVNDISQSELDLAPPEYETACFDVCGDVSQFNDSYDVVFSRTLAEHVPDGKQMHRNVVDILKPGGVALHMMPTLYALPFVINRLIPEEMSRKILFKFFPHRRTERPKFPAFYSWCIGNKDKVRGMLREVGYSKVEIRTFYGTAYFKSFPVIRDIDRNFNAFAAKRGWDSLGSYAHVTAWK